MAAVHTASLALLACSLFAARASAQAGGCQPEWVPTFGPDSGLDSSVEDLLVFDDGSGGGPALYAAGLFTAAGQTTLNHVGRWDGERWSALAGGVDGVVHALAVFDDGSGPALYAGGEFLHAGGVSAARIARWDGSQWSALATGMDDLVKALEVFDDGSGPALYAGGRFQRAGSVAAKGLARWNGASWARADAALPNFALVRCFCVFDDGAGAALHVGVSDGGGSTAMRWNGSSWTSIGGPLDTEVLAFAVFDDGSGAGNELYATGTFRGQGGRTTYGVTRLRGGSWSFLASDLDRESDSLAVFDGALYLSGRFTTIAGGPAYSIARWDGSAWSNLGSFMNTWATAMETFDDGSGGGPELYVGGAFTTVAHIPAKCMARWNGTRWAAVGRGLDDLVHTLVTHDDGGGTALYAGGFFDLAGGIAAHGVARWDATGWSALGSGTDSTVLALASFDDGTGPALYAGGAFVEAGGVTALHVAKWDGASWSALGGGRSLSVWALQVFDAGSGDALYAGGTGLARWNGVTWSSLATVNVRSLTVFDDGTGPALYVGGSFSSVNGVAASNVARWNGTSWSALGSGLSGGSPSEVDTLTVFDDGSGPALYAGGTFTNSGGVPVSRVARWNGASWSRLSSGMAGIGTLEVFTLRVFDDGSGDALYAAGYFASAGGIAASGVARWDGASWSALGNGTSAARALGVFDDGQGGPALFVGVTHNPDSGDDHLARWQGCIDTLAPEIQHPARVGALDRGAPGEVVTFTVTATDTRDPAPSVVCVPPSGSFFASGTTIVTCTATDASGNQAVSTFPVVVLPRWRERSR